MSWGEVELEPEITDWYRRLDDKEKGQVDFHIDRLEQEDRNEGADREYIDVGPCDVVSFPAGVARRFTCIETPEGEETALLQFVVAGEFPQAEYTEKSLQTIAETPT